MSDLWRELGNFYDTVPPRRLGFYSNSKPILVYPALRLYKVKHADFGRIQTRYYCAWQVGPSHKHGEVAQRRLGELLVPCLTGNTPLLLIFILSQFPHRTSASNRVCLNQDTPFLVKQGALLWPWRICDLLQTTLFTDNEASLATCPFSIVKYMQA